MLSRRFLRIKTMQALYSYFKNDRPDMAAFEKELFKSIEQVYDLYLILLDLFAELHKNALAIIDENKNKRLPSQHDLNPNLKFVRNAVLVALSESKELQEQLEKRKLNFSYDKELVRKLLAEIKKTEEFDEYMSNDRNNLKEDRMFLMKVVVKVLNENDVLSSIFEDKNIYWADDTHIAYNMVLRNFDVFEGDFKLMPLYKDEKDDKEFVSVLFKKTILYKEGNIELIQEHVKNWELDRIAEMDMLLMQMCITEFVHIPSVPVKASLNEYIDISKEYSTPSSKTFINGILDKIVAQLKSENRIKKEGRGLKDN